MVSNVVSLMDYKQKKLDKRAAAAKAYEEGVDVADIFKEMSTEELERFVNFLQSVVDDDTGTVTLTVIDDENN